jgi:hypothetical protein
MAAETPATRSLKALGIRFELHRYDYDPDGERVGLQAAEALGEPPQRVLKTLIIRVDGKPACVVLPSDRQVSMKKAAAAFGAKSAAMMPVPDAERADRLQGRRQPVRTEARSADHYRSERSGGVLRLRQWRAARAPTQARAGRFARRGISPSGGHRDVAIGPTEGLSFKATAFIAAQRRMAWRCATELHPVFRTCQARETRLPECWSRCGENN